MKHPAKGFTIVELLIVVVVIAILAAITIVAYNGINRRAQQTALQANLSQTGKAIHAYKTINGAPPASLSQLNDGKGPSQPSDASYAYARGLGDAFCLTITSQKTTDAYYFSDSSGVTAGNCPSYQLYPTRLGYTNLTSSYGSGDTILAQINAIPIGSWMVVIMAYNSAEIQNPPSGWTTLARKGTNTLRTTLFAKIKEAGDNDAQEFESPGTDGRLSMNAAILWGGNSGPVSSWILGSFGDRASNATTTTALTPTTTTTSARSLVLSIATERTNADEANYTSLTGATPWVWIPQPTGNTAKNQTITVGYNEQAAVGTTLPMTVTYPNALAQNATAVQLVIPPAN